MSSVSVIYDADKETLGMYFYGFGFGTAPYQSVYYAESPIPEPSALVLLSVGLVGLVARRKPG